MNYKLIKLNGRYYFDGQHYQIFNGGSGFSFKMKGKGFSITLSSIPTNGYFYIIVDRNYLNKVKHQINEKPINFSFSGEGVHCVDIVKANEANDNAIILIDLVVDGEQLPYDFNYAKKVRVFGDSTIAGYGILEHQGVGSINNSDAVKDFCYHALYELGYDMDLFAASGWGLTFSIYTEPNNIGIVNFVDKVAVHKSIPWRNEDGADLLIISLGTNDNSFIQEGMINRQDGVKKFVNKYKALIDSELFKNKDLKILMVYGTLKEEDAYYLNKETYRCLKPQYPNLFIHKFHGDNSAVSNHAYVDVHDEMSEELKEVIKEIL